jgi:hypothetical protein
MAGGMGFEYFYGFMGGETTSGRRTCSAITRRSSRGREAGYNLTTDMADEAIST